MLPRPTPAFCHSERHENACLYKGETRSYSLDHSPPLRLFGVQRYRIRRAASGVGEVMATDAFSAQIIELVRRMPDEAILELVKNRLGMAPFRGLTQQARAPRNRAARAAAAGPKSKRRATPATPRGGQPRRATPYPRSARRHSRAWSASSRPAPASARARWPRPRASPAPRRRRVEGTQAREAHFSRAETAASPVMPATPRSPKPPASPRERQPPARHRRRSPPA